MSAFFVHPTLFRASQRASARVSPRTIASRRPAYPNHRPAAISVSMIDFSPPRASDVLKLVVFDLEGTLLDHEMNEIAGSPFAEHPCGDVIDRDGTLVQLQGNSRELLRELHTAEAYRDVRVAVLNRTGEPLWERECMRKIEIGNRETGPLKMTEVVDFPEISGDPKIDRFEELRRKSGVEYGEMIFYSNEGGNVDAVKNLGVHCWLCPRGITKEIWEESLNTEFSQPCHRQPPLQAPPQNPSTLMPDLNPTANHQAISQNGASYALVFDQIQELYPAEQLSQRNAASRTDGYWPFISKGVVPPLSLTYGEFDFFFFAQLLDTALSYSPNVSWKDCVFCDVGSGTGRLVFAGALLHSWKSSRGVEILPLVHKEAEKKLAGVERLDLRCGSFDNDQNLRGADCIFCFSSCFTSDTMQSLADAVGTQCMAGTIVITTDYMLPLQGNGYQLDLKEVKNGWCWLTGGASTAFVHGVVQSLTPA
mmetsp:Transcript_26739/g.67049  ORF Transcript_26739/g.67049 Transcript_26739/m.67049 type:complete len:479 (+) Transcript_26739:92-1528(+)